MLLEVVVLTLFLWILKIFDLLPWPRRNALDLGRHKKYETAQEKFVRGLQQLNKTVLILNDAEINSATFASTIKAIAQSMCPHICQAHEHLSEALKVWEDEKARQDEEVEILVSSIGSLKRSVSENKAELIKLNGHLSLLNDQIKNNERQLEQAYDSLRQARHTLEESERQLRKKREGKGIVAGAGIITTIAATFLGGPVGLVVAGAAAVTTNLAYEDVVKYAERSVTSAKENVNSCTNTLSEKGEKKENLDRELSEKELENKRAEESLKRKEEQLEKLKEQQTKFSELGVKLKRTCHAMTIIWGKSRVANSEAQCAYNLETMLTPLREIYTMLTPEEQIKIKKDTLLLSNDFKFHANDAISLKLNTICDKADHSVMAILDQYT